MSREVSGGRAVPPRASSSSSGARSTTRVHYSRTQGQDKTGVSSRESYRNMFRDTRELPAADVTAEPSVAQLAEQMKAMQEMIAALSKQQTPQAAPLAPPTSQPTPLAAPMPPPAPLTPQPVTPAPQPTPPVPVLGPTEMMVLGSDILDVVKQLDLAAVEEVETSGTSWDIDQRAALREDRYYSEAIIMTTTFLEGRSVVSATLGFMLAPNDG